MNDLPLLSDAARDLRPVHRALGELRRGAPVLVTDGTPLLVLAAETLSATGLADAASLGGIDAGPVVLVRARHRAPAPDGSEDGRPGAAPARFVSPAFVSLALSSDLGALAISGTDRVRRFADPTRDAPPASLAPAKLPEAAAEAITLTKRAGLLPAIVAVELGPEAAHRARDRDVLSVRRGQIRGFADRRDGALEIVAEAPVPLADAGEARLVAFRAPDAGIEHLAVVIGSPRDAETPPLVRLHSECFTGDLLGSLRCDCGDQLRGAIRRMSAEGGGVLLYLAQEGRGIGLVNKLRAYTLQDRGLDTLDANLALGFEADERRFLMAATMLRRLGIGRVRLLTNNPDKIAALSAHGIEVAERVELVIPANGVDDAYLATKRRRFGHLAG